MSTSANKAAHSEDATHLLFFFFFAHRAFFFFLLISLPVPFCGLCTLKAHMRRAVAFLNVTSPINVTNCSRPYLISLSLTVPFSTQPPVPTAPAGVDGGPSPPHGHPPFLPVFFFPRSSTISPSLNVCLALNVCQRRRRAFTLHLLQTGFAHLWSCFYHLAVSHCL